METTVRQAKVHDIHALVAWAALTFPLANTMLVDLPPVHLNVHGPGIGEMTMRASLAWLAENGNYGVMKP